MATELRANANGHERQARVHPASLSRSGRQGRSRCSRHISVSMYPKSLMQGSLWPQQNALNVLGVSLDDWASRPG